ncbi:MAG TPA: outer membrane beta-barrel protein [Gammaproteobacteria bacterium]|nr:outer membrane beta-barrel protein [Gammaproteobacteria bacterium]
MKLKQQWAFFGFLTLGISSMPVHADFGVVDSARSAAPYGNAQTENFHRAITGGTTLRASEEAELSAALPVHEVESYYARLRLNFSTLTLDALKNRSSGLDKTGVVAKKRVSVNQSGLEVALGYSWSPSLRADIEYLVNKNLDYTASPVLTGTGLAPRQLKTQIKNSTVLANVYYEFLGLNRFKPYLTIGLGPSMNSVQSTITPVTYDNGGSATLRKLGVAWALGGGLRVAVFSRWHIDVSYRYIRLGNGINIKPTSNFKLLGTTSLNAVSLGLMYYF